MWSWFSTCTEWTGFSSHSADWLEKKTNCLGGETQSHYHPLIFMITAKDEMTFINRVRHRNGCVETIFFPISMYTCSMCGFGHVSTIVMALVSYSLSSHILSQGLICLSIYRLNRSLSSLCFQVWFYFLFLIFACLSQVMDYPSELWVWFLAHNNYSVNMLH